MIPGQFWQHLAGSLRELAHAVEVLDLEEDAPPDAMIQVDEPPDIGKLPEDSSSSELLRLSEAAEILGLSKATVRRMVDTGQLPHTRGPGKVRPRFFVPVDAVEELEAEIDRMRTVRGVTAGRHTTYTTNGAGRP